MQLHVITEIVSLFLDFVWTIGTNTDVIVSHIWNVNIRILSLVTIELLFLFCCSFTFEWIRIGSISQYIQKLNDSTRIQHCIQPSTSIQNNNNSNALVEPKRYGCPYCSLMTKSTSSIYKHQSRKHASFPKIVHKYSTDDPNTRCLVAVLKQKTIKSLNCFSLLFWNRWNQK